MSALRRAVATAAVIIIAALGAALAVPGGASAAPAAALPSVACQFNRAASSVRAPVAVPLSGACLVRVQSKKYPALFWTGCDAPGNDIWIYLEDSSSQCGSGGEAHYWSFSFVSGQIDELDNRDIEVCASNDHSGITKLLWTDAAAITQSIEDVAGGSCGLGRWAKIEHWWVNWGGETSLVQVTCGKNSLDDCELFTV